MPTPLPYIQTFPHAMLQRKKIKTKKKKNEQGRKRIQDFAATQTICLGIGEDAKRKESEGKKKAQQGNRVALSKFSPISLRDNKRKNKYKSPTSSLLIAGDKKGGKDEKKRKKRRTRPGSTHHISQTARKKRRKKKGITEGKGTMCDSNTI